MSSLYCRLVSDEASDAAGHASWVLDSLVTGPEPDGEFLKGVWNLFSESRGDDAILSGHGLSDNES